MSKRNVTPQARPRATALLIAMTLGLFGATSAFADTAPEATAPSATPEQTPAKPANTLESLKELDGKAPARRDLNIQTWQTAEGAKVMFVEAHELPMFDLRLIFAAGSSQDQKTPGIALLTNAMLNEGVKGKDVSAIAEGFEGLGADFGNGSYRDMAVASLRSLSATDKRDPALKLFSDVVGKPTFPSDSLARIKNQLLASFEYQKQNPGKLAGDELFKRLYGDHPYAHPSDGTAKSITPITIAQLKAFHARAYAAGNTVIALVGDLSRSEAETVAAQVSSSLPKGPALPKMPQPAEPKAVETHIEFPSKQTHLMLAELGIDRADPDYAALSLGNSVLGGGGFGSRLMTEVREKRGLSYGVSSGFTPMQAQGPFMIGLQTRAELSDNTLKLVKDIVRDYLANGPTQKELDDAKRELAGSFPLSTASNSAIVGQLGAIGFYGLPLNYLEDFMQQSQSLTIEQVKAVMNKHLDADKLVIVTAGPTVPQKPLPPPTDKPAEQPLGVPEH
jgi:zinc protease